MRIGIIRRRYSPYGGAEVFLKRFIDELLKRGHAVTVFSVDWPETGGVRLHRVSAGGPSFLKPLCFAMKAKKAVKKDRQDIVISLERTLLEDIYRAGDGCHREWLARRMPTVTPLKRFLISINPRHRVLLYLERRLFTAGGLKMVAANSERGKAEIIRHYGLPEKKICVIYNGINTSDISRIDREQARLEIRKGLGIEPAAVALLFVGSGFERKGLLYLIRALKHLKEKRVRLIVIGRGSVKKYLKEARGLGVEDLITFLGPRKDTLKYYGGADIFVLPSIYEPFSNACLEAMASGLPVVTSRVNGVSEIITEGGDGAVVEDPTDPQELARAIESFLPEQKRERAADLAREKAGRFTMEKTVGEFLDLINV